VIHITNQQTDRPPWSRVLLEKLGISASQEIPCFLYGEVFLALSATLKLEDHPLSTVRDLRLLLQHNCNCHSSLYWC